MSEDDSQEKATEKKAKEQAGKKSRSSATVDENSLVYIDYVGRTKDDGKIFDLTDEEVAKEEGLYKEDGRYEPVLVAIGWNWLLGALEEEIVGMKVGEKKTIEIPPEKGAGPRDPKKIKLIAKTKLAKQGVRPMKGEEITFGHERGVVSQVLGRRVRVDFNSPLAGKTLVFDVTVREIVTDTKDKMMAVIKRRIPGLPEDTYSVSVKGKVVTVNLPKESRYIQDVQYAEIGIAADLLKVHEAVQEVKLVVTFERPEPPKTEKDSS
ncbi:MAG: peptidylprolyl isomerase [Candidatus Thorarchaeota archaeon]|nr:MAG: peptidylprolyl isomerase [Candidatus Thorarchaeota archaeon]